MPTAAPLPPDRTRRLVLLGVGGLGAVAVMTQLALLRELLGAFSGNEFVFGIALGCWLLLTGLGTWLGRAVAGPAGSEGRSSTASPPSPGPPPGSRLFLAGLIAVALLPLAQVLAVRGLRDVVFLRGAAVGVTGTVLGTVALLLPFCLVSGAMLTLACGVLARAGDAAGLGRVYVADTVGSIVGGALFSFVLVPWFDHFALLCFPAGLNLLLAGALAWHCRSRGGLLAAALALAGLVVLVARIDLDDVSTQWQHAGRHPVFRANSPYGRLVVVENAGQLTFFENGVPAVATQTIEQVEETVHYGMSQRPTAQHVLLISGGVAGAAREILRYRQVAAVTYVELDPAIITAGRRLLSENLADARIHVVETDGRRFVQQTAARFEVVIVAVPDPSTAQLNRFYTAEFFAGVKRILAPGGVLAFGLGRYENYVSPELAHLLASARQTLQTAFAHVRLIPGGRVFFLASDGPVDADIAARLEQLHLSTRLVNRHYLDAMLTPDRLADLDRAVAQPAARNTDFAPALYYYHLRLWLSQFTFHGGLIGAALLLGLAVYVARLGAVPRAIFAAGFAATALEVVLLLVFQALYGSLYRQVGLIVTVFMAGLAGGAGAVNRWLQPPASPPRQLRLLARLALALAALAALLPAVLPRLGGLDAAVGSTLAGQGAMLGLTFILATLVGAQFPVASAAEPDDAARTASRLYTADLAGAALGALLVSTLLIPLLGVTAVCLLTAGLNLAAAALVWRHRSRA